MCFAIALGACQLMPAKPVPPPEPKPALPCSTEPPRELEREAIELLDAGDTAAARAKLECVLELSPGSSQATLLLKQLDADPRVYLGSEYFWHTVQSNETLSKIAQAYRGNALEFVILARYNDIEIPADIVAGQRIKIPGREPPPSSAPPPPPEETPTELHDRALQKEQEGDIEQAYTLIRGAHEKDASLDGIESDLARIQQELISNYVDEAWDLEFAGKSRQALDTWRRILAIMPTHVTAQLRENSLLKQLEQSPED
jgi:hypothetical protein